jgi:hypothetical protein
MLSASVRVLRGFYKKSGIAESASTIQRASHVRNLTVGEKLAALLC